MKYDEKRNCPKCGCDLVSTHYNPDRGLLKRQCQRCSYDWWEAPLNEEK